MNITINNQPFTIGIYKKSAFTNLVLAKIQNETMETSAAMQKIIANIDIEKSFEELLNRQYVPVNYNVFINRDINEGLDISPSEIKALSVIMYKDSGLHHFIFLKNKMNKFTINDKFSAITDGLNLKDLYLVFENVINLERKEDMFSLITTVTPPFDKIIDKVRTKNELRNILSEKAGIVNLNNTLTKVYPGDSGRCDSYICTPIQDMPAECKQMIGDWGCVEKEDRCLVRSVANAYDKWAEFSAMKDTFYIMRDSIFAKSHNGEAIIDNYYLAGKYIYANLGTLDLNKMYDYITLLYTKSAFLISNHESSVVLIDETTKDDLLNTTDELRSLSTDKEWQDCLDWIESMIENFEGTRARDIYSYISN